MSATVAKSSVRYLGVKKVEDQCSRVALLRPRDVEAEARKFHRFRFHIEGKNRGRKKLVLLSFGEERIEGAYKLRNESKEEAFREMLTPT